MLCGLMMSATSELQKWMLDGQGPANAYVGTTTGSSQILVEGVSRRQDIFGGLLCQHGTHRRTLCLRAVAVAPLLRGLNAFDGDEDVALPCATTRGCTPARTGVLLLGFMGDSADCAAPMLLGVELSEGGVNITPCIACRKIGAGVCVEVGCLGCMMHNGSGRGQEPQRASSQAPLVSRWRVAPHPLSARPHANFEKIDKEHFRSLLSLAGRQAGGCGWMKRPERSTQRSQNVLSRDALKRPASWRHRAHGEHKLQRARQFDFFLGRTKKPILEIVIESNQKVTPTVKGFQWPPLLCAKLHTRRGHTHRPGSLRR
jgi:hypothetical protein